MNERPKIFDFTASDMEVQKLKKRLAVIRSERYLEMVTQRATRTMNLLRTNQPAAFKNQSKPIIFYF